MMGNSICNISFILLITTSKVKFYNFDNFGYG
jgi:hypothetical protein